MEIGSLTVRSFNVCVIYRIKTIEHTFELRSVFLFNCPAPGKSSWVKKVQIPHSRVIIVGQKNSTNDQKSLPRADL